MGKKAKAQKAKNEPTVEHDGKGSSEKTKHIGCISPTGCLVGTPIDPMNPGDAIKMSCSNEGKCTEVQFIHPQCFEALEAMLLRQLDAHAAQSRRGSTWTDQQKVANLWMKKGYEILYKACPCPCSGYVRKDIDYRPPGAVDDGKAQQVEKKKKKAKAKAAEKPQLDKPWGYKKTTLTLLDKDDPAKRWEMVANHGHHVPSSTPVQDVIEDSYIPGLHLPSAESKTSTASVRQQPTLAGESKSPKSKEASMHDHADSRERSRRESLDSSSKGGRLVDQSEITTVEELICTIDSLLPNGTYPKCDFESHVDDVLSRATVDILSMIEEQDGFWQWICLSEDGPHAPFKLSLTDGMITKVPVSHEPSNAHTPSNDGDNLKVEIETSDTRPRTLDPPKSTPLPSESKPKSSAASRMKPEPKQANVKLDESFKIDPEVRRSIEAHIVLSSSHLYTESAYPDVLDEIRFMSRQMSMKTFW